MLAFVARVVREIQRSNVSLDLAFQRVKASWRRLPSFKVMYDVAFDVVRHYHFLRFAAERMYGSASGRAVARAWFVFRAGEVLGDRRLVEGFARRLAKRARVKPRDVLAELEAMRGSDPVAYLAIRYSYPRRLVEELARVMPLGELEAMLAAGNVTWTWLRINTLRADVDKVLKSLEREAEVEQHPETPFAVLVRRARRPIQYLEAVRRFEAVPQDLASILTVLALRPEPGDEVLDAAAAPGMKTSLIMQLAENRARVVAVDVSPRRLARMRALLRRLGVDVDRVELVLGDSRRLAGRRFPKALVDAPCTSSGAMTKDPAVKLALARLGRLRWFTDIQAGMLRNVAGLVEPGGSLVYATCSVLPQEGEDVVEVVGLRARKPLPSLADAYRGVGGGRTFPHTHRSEGFYIAEVVAEDGKPPGGVWAPTCA